MDKLKFTNKALYRLEKEKGVKLGDLQKMGDISEFRFSLVVDLLWAGRLYQNPNLTVDHVMEQVDFANMEEYGELIADAFEEAFGDIETSEEKGAGNAAGG